MRSGTWWTHCSLVETGFAVVENLPDHGRGRGIVKEGIRAVGGDQRDAEALKESKARLLLYQVSSKAAGGLDDDRAHAVAGNVLQHRAPALSRER